jgi:hypothetical protein
MTTPSPTGYCNKCGYFGLCERDPQGHLLHMKRDGTPCPYTAVEAKRETATPTHTPEPWESRMDDCPQHVRARGGGAVATTGDATYHGCGKPDVAAANAARIVACVNALTGVGDPAAYVEGVHKELNYLYVENERLRAMEAPIPKTKDGVPYYINMEVWHPRYADPSLVQAWGIGRVVCRFYYAHTSGLMNDWEDVRPEHCYSTRAACEAAINAKGETK